MQSLSSTEQVKMKPKTTTDEEAKKIFGEDVSEIVRYLQSSRSVAERVMEATGVKSLSGKTFVWTDPFSFL
ncbi:hypothetical protein F2Q69_00060098 [Brassica cretica]|uniref:Uncharacterized protein n=1 Tax=Brassica cretica TaxID=69181 RepID=A0A8S9RHJ8_BRACR|nr:hypothetical protein F2Q69_00060098 [Brassica cretica]